MRLRSVPLLMIFVFVAALVLCPSKALAGPVIVLDPGHSGASLTTIDDQTQIRDEEYCNVPEITDVFDVAVRLKARLEAAGYTVLMTKAHAQDTVTKRQRSDVANGSRAALAVSIHTSGHSFGNYGEIYVQKLTSYRENVVGQKVFFSDAAVAALSAAYGQIFLAERRKIEGSSVVVTVNTGWGARGLAPGNLPIVQLFSEVPWILTEAGAPSSSAERDRYAQSLFNSITACVPVDSPAVTPVIPVTRFDQADERISTDGAWETLARSGSSGGSYGRSLSSNASATIHFSGTQVTVLGTRGTTTGITDVYLDGELQEKIDTYSSIATYARPLWSSDELPAGPHAVELVRDAHTVAGRYLTLDAVDITGALAAAPPSITALTPGAGTAMGGVKVNIIGTGFVGVTGVTFGGIAADITSVDVAHGMIVAVAPECSKGTVQVQVAANGGKTADTSSDDFNYTEATRPARYQQTDKRIEKSSGWTNYSNTTASGGTYGRCLLSRASAIIFFKGTQLDWIALKGTTTGKADVYLDGAFKATVDLAASPAKGNLRVWSTGVLEAGEHWVRIVRSSANLSTKYVTLDAVDIYGTISDPPKRLEQGDTHLAMKGAWVTFPTTSASGSSYGRSKTIAPPFPASVTIAFHGDRIDWLATKGATCGIVDVYVDGTQLATVDLRAPKTAYKAVVWSSGTLRLADHVVRLERSKDSGTDAYLTLDAFDVWGSIRPAPVEPVPENG